MVHAKNFETMSTFIEVMQKKLWPVFSGHGVYPMRRRDQRAGRGHTGPHMSGTRWGDES